eukprot:CAMPEP_0197023740 /NCGR_PEP_ID=MMETSP1384-20130603/4390_1 /TAXON_ID=29189 /ORGANISM="Ammonia sp." /LENGTH=603 /DNA_ID=CAMNT_0042452001 /DNA_START=26 /DNA_END=1837 /DNA_ORIENTATION=-
MATPLETAQKRIRQLEARLAKFEGSSGEHVMGHPSTMPDRAYQLSLTPYINRAAALQPESGVYTKIEEGYSFQSYRDITRKGQKLASALSNIGIGVGDSIATFMYNNGRHFLLHYTSACSGFLLNPLNFRLFPGDLVFMLNHVRSKVIFIDALLLPEFEKVPFNELNTVKTVVVCGENEAPNGWTTKMSHYCTVVDFDAFLSRGQDSFVWPRLDERSAVSICFTSGTTGQPKGVIFSHRSTVVHLMAMLMNDFLAVSGTDCWLPLAPMFHAGAWNIPYLALCLGNKVVLSNQYSDAPTQMRMISDHKVTLYSGVPTVMQSLRTEYESNPARYRQIKGVLSRIMTGGSAPPPELLQWYKNELNVDVLQIWGMTEMNPFGTYGRRFCRRRDIGKSDEELIQNQLCAGIPLPSVEIKVVNPDNFDEELPWDGKSVGELLARGISTCNSYFKVDQEVLNKKFHRGWLVTGDLATRTESGQLVIKDRSKDMIKSGGEWISSVDLENHIMGLNGVDKACVVAVSHKKWMQRPIVIVSLKDGVSQQELSLERIRLHCSTRFAKYQLPDDVLYWEEIPLTGSGKMSKKDVRVRLEKIGYAHPSERAVKSKL